MVFKAKTIFLTLLFLATFQTANADIYKIYPGLARINEVSGFSIRTINNTPLVNPDLVGLLAKGDGNLLLLQKVNEFLLIHQDIDRTELANIDLNFQWINEKIKDLDLVLKIASLATGNVEDFTYLVWDELIEEDFKAKYSSNENYDVLYETVKGSLQVMMALFVEKYGWKSAWELTPAAKWAYAERVGWWVGAFLLTLQGSLYVAKAINAIDGLNEIWELDKSKDRTLAVVSFLNDYVLKFGSNMKAMSRAYVRNSCAYSGREYTGEKGENENADFWAIWSCYQAHKVFRYYPTQDSYEAALIANRMIMDYGSKSYYSVYSLTYRTGNNATLFDVRTSNRIDLNYYIPNSPDWKRDENGRMHTDHKYLDDLKMSVDTANWTESAIFGKAADDGGSADVASLNNVKIITQFYTVDSDNSFNYKSNLTNEISFNPMYILYLDNSCYEDLDTVSYIYRDAICGLKQKGVIATDQENFRPEDKITRGEFSKMLSGVMEKYMFEVFDDSHDIDYFKDVYSEEKNNEWMKKYVRKMVSRNIAQGSLDPLDQLFYFRPELNINYRETAKMVTKAIRGKVPIEKNLNTDDFGLKYYLCFSNNKTGGYPSDILYGGKQEVYPGGLTSELSEDAITRADAALIIYRAFILGYIEKREENSFSSCAVK